MSRGSRARISNDPEERPSMLDRISDLIERQNQLRVEEAMRREDKTRERDSLEDYRDLLREITERDVRFEHEQGIRERNQDEQLVELAEAAVLESGKNALRNSPHQSERLSEGEIASIEGVSDPRLANNQAARTAMEATKHQIRAALPAEIAGSELYLSLEKLTRPRKAEGELDNSSFANRSGMQGRVKSEIQAGRVKDLVERVDEQVAADEVVRLREEEVTDEGELASAGQTYHDVVDMMTSKRRRGEEVSAEDVQLVATHRLRLMEGMRDYIPKWAPENPQRWISMGDRYVFDISLAAVPEELVKDTAAYEGMQDLMRNEAVFALRAPELSEDAIGRKSSQLRRETAAADAKRDAEAKAESLRPRLFLTPGNGSEWIA